MCIAPTIKRDMVTPTECVSVFLFCSACEGRDVWGDRRPPLLQQEQDWRAISNSQMFLLPWTSCWHHSGHAFLCWWYVPTTSIIFGFVMLYFSQRQNKGLPTKHAGPKHWCLRFESKRIREVLGPQHYDVNDQFTVTVPGQNIKLAPFTKRNIQHNK